MHHENTFTGFNACQKLRHMVTSPQKLRHIVTSPHFEKMRGDVGIDVGKCVGVRGENDVGKSAGEDNGGRKERCGGVWRSVG